MNKFEYISKSNEDFDLPQRSTEGSAGYDFRSPQAFSIKPNETIEIGLEVKCQIKKGEVLMLFPRSSLGFKKWEPRNVHKYCGHY